MAMIHRTRRCTLANITSQKLSIQHDTLRRAALRLKLHGVSRCGNPHNIALYRSSASSIIYQWQEEIENLEEYRHGGYHPLCINDELNHGQYHVVHKLGFGSHSTVWLAQDKIRATYVAIKVAASATKKLSKERSILEHLSSAKQSQTSPSGSVVPSLLDCFSVEGPNGLHECFVSTPSRCSLAVSKDASTTRLFPLEAARAIAAQLILGVNYLHSHGVVHADLHLGNILLQLPTLDVISIEELYSIYGEPQKALIRRLDGAPPGRETPLHTVVPIWLGIDCEDITIEDALVQFCDFGEAFQPEHESRTVSHVPFLLRPPEVNFDDHCLSFPADIWTLACTVYEILGERTLFDGFMPDEDDVLAENVSAVGELPPQWNNAWKARQDFFTSDGRWKEDTKRRHDPRSRPSTERVNNMGRDGFSSAERSDLLEMLSRMLIFRPEERINAEELIQVKWMQDWGLPSVAKLLRT